MIAVACRRRPKSCLNDTSALPMAGVCRNIAARAGAHRAIMMGYTYFVDGTGARPA